MNPFLKYKVSLDVQNLKELIKEKIVIFSPKIKSFIELSFITSYIFSKSIDYNNVINNSVFIIYYYLIQILNNAK